MKKRGTVASQKSMKISDGAVTVTLRLYEPQFLLLKGSLHLVKANSYLAKEISFSKEGLVITGEKEPYTYVYQPDFFWSHFVQDFLVEDFNLKGQAAASLFKKYDQWAKNKSAEIALANLESGKVTFAELEYLAPYLKDHPGIQRKATYSAFSDTMPTRKGRRKKDQPPDAQLLIQWVGYYRADNSTTIEAAVGKALIYHPELVPPHWKEPEDALAKAYKRSIQNPRSFQLDIA
ncbi:MAG: hypothetical protein IPJ38_13695 [Dechloromonas sp.]|uniref:Uncharacterized protein n=1 Tax=Candidatus Dechloromonas phosphorivorans TaxID=2899244 RepID=A0A935KC58_9RHOO|nr:hypothetical protein [Candidatus Dechloromonas phosphorivorans]